MAALIQDLRYGFRMLAKNPAFTAVAVLTLALGIGANTAIFSLIDAVMFHALPVRDQAKLVVMRWTAHKMPDRNGTSSYGDCVDNYADKDPSACSLPYPFFEQIRSEKEAFSGATAFAGPAQLVLSGDGPPRIARGELVTGDYFSTLGVKALVGRILGPEDDIPNAAPSIVLTYAFWQSAFGGERSAMGRTVSLNSVPFTIVGIMEPKFTSLTPGKTQDMFLPLSMISRLNVGWGTRDYRALNNWWLVIVARLKPGISLGQAQAAASLTFRNEMLHGEKPLSKASDDPSIILTPAQSGLGGRRGFFSKPLYVLMFAVGFVLLIACANVAGLLLSRGAARHKEMAVRLALGAGRARMVRQLLTESVTLSLGGGALGVLFAFWGVDALTAMMVSNPDRPFPFVVGPDWRVLAFTISISLLTGILFGLAPAWRSTRLDLTPALKENSQTLPGGENRPGRWFHLGKAMVVIQVALSMIVLVGAGLLVRTLQNLRSINPGFDTSNLLLFGINPTLAKYPDSKIQNLYRQLQERLAALPGVTSVSYSSSALLSGSLWTSDLHVEGQPEKATEEVDMLATGPDFFKTLRIPLVGGRAFTSSDFQQAAQAAAVDKASQEASKSQTPAIQAAAPTLGPPPIPVLVNQAFVGKYFAGQNPLGKRLTQGDSSSTSGGSAVGKPPSKSWEIIGVADDTKYSDLRRAVHPAVYVPVTGGGASFELRMASNPAALIPAVRKTVNDTDSSLPIFDVSTQSQHVDELLTQERVIARLASFFGLLALVLACVGLYGLLSYEVARRTREIGIRMALGAESSDVLRTIGGQGIRVTVIGLAVGIVGGWALTRFLSSLLFGLKPTDLTTFTGVSVILMGVALLACYIPARRATKVDPMVALRYE
ncbi:MAG TPA: ABC transporter permease [Terriglobia bacterium]|nr:ABC transporter permease [Terriglobia bacterium]